MCKLFFSVMLLISGWLWRWGRRWGIDTRFLPVFREVIFPGGVSVGDKGVVSSQDGLASRVFRRVSEALD